MNTRVFASLSVLCLGLALSACAPEKVDVHAAPRETKAYESVAPSKLSHDALVAHLKTIAAETGAAVEGGHFGELHHLEVALTAALDAFEKSLPGTIKAGTMPKVQELRTLAVKLHDAGHDQNKTMATKVNARIQILVGGF